MSELDEWEFDEGVQIVDGYNTCIIGKDYKDGKAVYSIERMIELMMTRDGLTMEQSIEYFDHNIGTAYIGEMTPIYIWQGENYNDNIYKLEKVQES
jgi:hypothetical protein